MKTTSNITSPLALVTGHTYRPADPRKAGQARRISYISSAIVQFSTRGLAGRPRPTVTRRAFETWVARVDARDAAE